MQAFLKNLVLPAALLTAGLVGACYPKAGPAPGALSPNSVTWASSKWPGVTPAQLAAGHDAFIDKCNNCHSYPDLNAIEDEKWPHITEWMGKKADLPPEKREALLRYILASRHP